jgi:hypothetical protein
MKSRFESELIREEFISFLSKQSPDVREWLINNISNFFCEECFEEISDCLCKDIEIDKDYGD